MNKLVFFASVFLLSFLSSCHKENGKVPDTIKSIKDDLNYTVSLAKTPRRVISLAPNITEILFAIGAGDKLIGNTLYCNYPEEAKKITRVGDMLSIDYEKILSLKPDLIFITVEGNVKDSFEKLRSLGFKVFVSNPRNYEGIKKTFTDFAKIFNMEDKASLIISGWDFRYKKITNEVKNYPSKKAMFLIGLNPIILAGKNTFINELITSVGLSNIASDSPLNYPIFSREEVLKRNPDYILMTGMTNSETKNLVEAYREWKSLKAVRNGRVIVVDPDLYLRPGPRFVDALENLFNKLHPH
ncbi:MAG: cobalamin-binding protein [Ignavibacteriales bacterium]|nr:cobalamin-binding protein [Ignavibacteriales bacterium]